jgi:hypothetical protein
MLDNLVLVRQAIKDVMITVVFLVWRFIALQVKPLFKTR